MGLVVPCGLITSRRYVYVYVCVHVRVYVYIYMCIRVSPAVPQLAGMAAVVPCCHCCAALPLLFCLAGVMPYCHCFTALPVLCHVATVSLLCHCYAALPLLCSLPLRGALPLSSCLATVPLHCCVHVPLPRSMFTSHCITYLLVASPGILFTLPHGLLACLLCVGCGQVCYLLSHCMCCSPACSERRLFPCFVCCTPVSPAHWSSLRARCCMPTCLLAVPACPLILCAFHPPAQCTVCFIISCASHRPVNGTTTCLCFVQCVLNVSIMCAVRQLAQQAVHSFRLGVVWSIACSLRHCPPPPSLVSTWHQVLGTADRGCS